MTKKKKKKINFREKGKQYERDVARKLSEWWFPNLNLHGLPANKLPIRRSWGSGGWDKRSEPGDVKLLVPSAVPFDFSVEAKAREAWSFDLIMRDRESTDIWKWWKQCRKDARISKKTPLMIFTKNNAGNWAMLRVRDYIRIKRKAVGIADGNVLCVKRIRAYIIPLENLLRVPRETIERALWSES